MSVINQMLKNLEERAPEQSNNHHQAVAITQKTSSIKVISITLIVLLILNGLGLYIWSLVQENQALKSKNDTLAAVEPTTQIEKQLTSLQPKTDIEITKPITATPKASKKTILTHTVKPEMVKAEASELDLSNKGTSKQASVIESKFILVEAKADVVKPTASMSISRRQLTSEELVEQKISKADVAVNANNLTKAEQLFEEVLIIDPMQQQARKKLAALWFGRQSFNDAINLLSQGITLAPDNSEFRSMQAHIYLQQGRLKQAYNSLKPLADLPQQEYQLLLVNISQQLSEYNATIKAYKILLGIQPENSRWHLGLAIGYDKTSQFALAISEYNLALAQGGLSQDSNHFTNQRLQALGVK